MRFFNVMDLFAGVGGLSYGFSHSNGFNLVAANEIEPDIAKTYQLNNPDVPMINCDIKDLTKELLNTILQGKNVDLIVGGPPCQSYSTLGKREMDDRANLFTEYKRILEILKPKAFVFENVSGLLSMNRGQLFKTIQKEFSDIGYELKHKLLDAADFGIPQHRERIILVGMKGNNLFEYPHPTHGNELKNFVTLKDAIGDLPIIESGESGYKYLYQPNNDFLNFVRNTAELTEHNAPNNGEHLKIIMKTLKDGETKDDLPDNIRPKSGYANTYAKLWWNQPSTTITRNFACPSSSRCIHPRDSRAMTIREGARLQSFPDNFIFYGSEGMKRLEIGNAVPPLLSLTIAKQMFKAMNS